MNGFGLHVIPMVGLILLSWLGLLSLGMERGAPPAAARLALGMPLSPRLSFLEAKALKRTVPSAGASSCNGLPS